MKNILYSGMGAICGPEGVTFRVWAPNANKVFVTGTFNDWSDSQNELQAESNGYWSGHLENVKEGDEYKFILHNGDLILHKNDPYAKKMTNSVGNSVIIDLYKDWEDHEFRLNTLNKLVIYEMHIGTFNCEGLEEGQVGTFNTAVQKLDYLRDLGINTIEVMPVMEFPGQYSWGYNPSHPFAIEHSYGGPEGLKHFIFEAHIRGMAVIMDVVYNHFGPSDTDIWQFDGWQENGLGGIYFYNDHRAKTPWGENRPDYGREEVRNYLRDNAMMWLETYQCDGLRFDATAMIRLLEGYAESDKIQLEEGFNFLRDLNSEIRNKYPHKMLIAEDLKADPIVTAALENNGLGFHSQWGVGFVHTFKNVLKQVDDESRDLGHVKESLFNTFNDEVFQRVIFTESHDQVANGSQRLPEEIQPGQADGEFAKKKSTLGAIALFTAPGIPMIFQGQEFISDGAFDDTIPLDWHRVGHFNGIHDMYRDLIHLRRGSDARAKGLTGPNTEILHANQDTLIIAYTRIHLDNTDSPVIVILNFSNSVYQGYRIDLHYDGTWNVIFNSGWKGYDEEFTEVHISEVHTQAGDDNNSNSISVDIPAYGGIILAK